MKIYYQEDNHIFGAYILYMYFENDQLRDSSDKYMFEKQII